MEWCNRGARVISACIIHPLIHYSMLAVAPRLTQANPGLVQQTPVSQTPPPFTSVFIVGGVAGVV